MLRKQKRVLCMKFIAYTLYFLYLQLLLWSTFLRPTIDIEEQWVPKSFFFSTKQSTCNIRVHHNPMSLFESMFFAVIALVGYHCATTGMENIFGMGMSISTLANFEMSMMGIQQKYYWICFVPWIITFGQNWLQNIGEFLILLSGDSVYETNDYFPSVVVLMLFFCVQAMLASEVVCMALQGWYSMQNINDENVLWEQRKSIILGTRI